MRWTGLARHLAFTAATASLVVLAACSDGQSTIEMPTPPGPVVSPPVAGRPTPSPSPSPTPSPTSSPTARPLR